MGLFGSKKKEEVTARITDFFSAEDLSKIKELIGQKKAENAYKWDYMGEVNVLLQAASNTEEPLNKKAVTHILYSTGVMTKIEPSLNPILTPAIEKMRAFRK